MHDTTRKLFAISAVVALLVSSFGAGAAAIAWDDETGNTATTSDVAGNTGQTVGINYGSADNFTYFETDGASTGNLTLKIMPGADDVDYVVYKNTTAETVDAGAGHYAFNVSGDELSDAPRDVEGATYDVEIINQSSGNVVLSSDDVTINANSSNDQAVMAVAATSNNDGALTPLVADSVELEDKSGMWGLSSFNPLGNSSDDVKVSTWSGYTTIDGANSSARFLLTNSSTSESYSDVASNYDDGDWMVETTLIANGQAFQVYKNEAPDSVGDDESYAVYDADADEIVLETESDHYEDVRQLQVRGTASKGYGFSGIVSNFGLGAAINSLFSGII